MEKFYELVKLYKRIETVMSAICVEKGGIDIDNYSGRFFSADLLEFVVVFGEKLGVKGAELELLKEDLKTKKDRLTPGNKPIYDMTLAEFEKMIAYSEDK